MVSQESGCDTRERYVKREWGKEGSEGERGKKVEGRRKEEEG